MLRDLIQGMHALRREGDGPDRRYRDGRQVVRIRCHYDVECQIADQSHQGQIVDIGLGGMKLRCAQPLEVGAQVGVTCLATAASVPNPSVPCRVEWVRARERDGALFVGLTYDAPNQLLGQSWVKVLLRELGFRPERTFQRRRFLRAECVVPVRARAEGQLTLEGTLCNLGVQGALVESASPLALGTEIEFEIGPFEELRAFQAAGLVAQQASQGQHYLLGVRFEELSCEATDSLGCYLRTLLLNHWEV